MPTASRSSRSTTGTYAFGNLFSCNSCYLRKTSAGKYAARQLLANEQSSRLSPALIRVRIPICEELRLPCARLEES